ncbi:MAG: DNA cytosine methyltransferase [Fusobacteriaceae bacterium]
MLKVIELFAGVGSQTQALKNIGIEHEVIGISEIDEHAISSYMQLHGETPLLGDITKIKELPSSDLWTYSFPCQDLSVAGSGLGIKEGTRSGLLSHVERLLENSTKPQYLLMENVKNLISKKHIEDFDVWCKKLEELGYKNFWKVLNAKEYRVPQNRERVFMVSLLGEGLYEFPQKEQLLLKLKDILEEQPEEKHYLSSIYLERFLNSEPISSTDIKILGTTVGAGKGTNSRGWVHSVDGIVGTLSATDYKQPKQILSGKRIRRLTPKEYWRLMGWKSSEFNKIKNVSNTQLYKQAGNGIVVTVLEEIFRNLLIKNK